jgi:hypothetical protein
MRICGIDEDFVRLLTDELWAARRNAEDRMEIVTI